MERRVFLDDLPLSLEAGMLLAEAAFENSVCRKYDVVLYKLLRVRFTP